MSRTFLNSETKDLFFERIDAIEGDTAPRWGKMDAIHMFAHLLHSVRASLEEIPDAYHGSFFLKYVMRFLAFHTALPWPKGLETAPGYVVEPEGDFGSVKEDLKSAIARFVRASGETPERRTLHPRFVMQALGYWPRLHGRHMEHHFQQFGV